jgi:hypothetical protein
MASAIPIQFLGINLSLNNAIPKTVETNTIATLLIVKMEELSNPSLLKAITKK